MTVTFSDQMGVTLVDSMGGDQSIVSAARVSTGSAGTAEADRGLIKFLMKNRHASPFEHVTATFLVECPIFVTREWHRHRTQSFNETSGRYRILEPKFYIPGEDRPLQQIGKVGSYDFVVGTELQQEHTREQLTAAYTTAWDHYQFLLNQGVAKEVARMVLPVGIYTSFYATANLRNWLGFLSLRTAADAMQEIRDAAAKIETHLHRIAPVTLEAWDAFGRKAV
jgi:thymidylate synthase (FAD)